MIDLLERLKERADAAAILLDFDGTLSEIVEVPSEARPYPGIAETLVGLAARYRIVAIVSGRSAHQLVEWLGPELDIWGVHGAERSRAGETAVNISPAAAGFADKMRQVAREARGRVEELSIAGALVEDKRVMVVLHFRAARDRVAAERALDELAGDLAAKHDLWRAEGRMAFELRPPVALSKGDVVHALARGSDLRAILFAGDDRVDLPAFDALDALAHDHLVAVRVAVRSEEAPPGLLERADVIVEGPAGMLRLLQSLL